MSLLRDSVSDHGYDNISFLQETRSPEYAMLTEWYYHESSARFGYW